jgi:hypothetical protein
MTCKENSVGAGNRSSDTGRHNQCSASVPTCGTMRFKWDRAGLGLRLSTLSVDRLWAQVWFGQPATLRASRNRDSSGKSAAGARRCWR